ncbi:disulfide bond corrector protein DsbC [Flavobacterium sp. 90]|uniref:protein-disulfide reductase DsbD domain-containing protein n=1 Tax=unclassified Flavobacterium TaxID=196869 RepID=UPI000EB3984A|nr:MULTISPECIES: protein-disulfide reductase DsbD domain-containing protein [unclassified Flavobacterium]RKR05099.1 disulfide bond corrector protein DsbC [Flavobacterium sp. 81]TCK56415.1 disulfide bond corrector protein DsbC [Flavobacterium sp. 90]
MIVFKRYAFILFMILGVKSYAQKQPDTGFTKKVEKAASALKVKSPVISDPVSLNAQVVWNDNKSQVAVVIKVKVLPGWHIYAYVPKNQPYIQSKMVLELPKGVTPLSEWTKPNSYPYEDNIFVYEGQMLFTRYFSVKDLGTGAKISAGLFYQTCDIRQCLPPNTKVKELKL